MSEEISVTLSQSAKVTSPANQYENATFMVSLGVKSEIAPPPEDANEAEYAVWKKSREIRMVETTQELRDILESELQKDIDTFKEDNSK